MVETIIPVVKEAGKIVLQASNIRDEIQSKQGSSNYVTKYDVEVQEFLFRELKKLYPEAAFIGEEDDKKTTSQADTCFIIDPIDGTNNFIFDFHHSGISVAYCVNGKVEAAVVYNPYLDEVFSAEKGKGAYLNDRRLKMVNRRLAEGIVGIGTSPYYRDKTDQTFYLIRKLYDRSLDIRRIGSAALDLCYVAAGRYVLFLELVLSPWDFAAASLIVTEAGGIVRTMDGRSISLDNPSTIVAGTPSAYEEYVYLNI